MEGKPLRVNDVRKTYGQIKAVDGISFEVEGPTIVGIIGPNGSGKTTLIDVISGIVSCDSGEVYFGEENITQLAPYQRANRGLTRTFQITRELTGMTVMNNMLLAHPDQTGENILDHFTKFNAVKQVEETKRRDAKRWLKLLDLWELREEYAGNLSAGQRKLLELGRGLMTKPSMLMLDEPLAGVNPALAEDILQAIEEIKDRGVSLLIIEHELPSLMKISENIIVLQGGKLTDRGPPEQIRQSEDLIDTLLGGDI